MRAPLPKFVSISLTALVLASSAATTAMAGEADDAVLAEVNFARAHPQEYARRLLLQPVSTWERGLEQGGSPSDPDAYAEAIEFLMRQTPLPPLQADDKLAAAALEHVAEQGPAGAIGHTGPAGERFDARLKRHGVEAETSGENIAYGPADAADVVRELIIDSGVPSRGHRRNIFYQAFAAAGVSCGPHRDYDTMCVMDFASRAPEVQGWRQAQLTAVGRDTGLIARLMRWR